VVTDPRCRCHSIASLDGDQAGAYAREHLRLDAVAADGWSAMWSCADTGARWRETYFPAWDANDSQERLERLDGPASPPRTAQRRSWIRLTGIAISATVVAALIAEPILAR